MAVLGAAFKPNSNDVRDSPSLDVCGRLTAEDAIVSVHNPVAMPNAARDRPDLRYAASVSEAAEGADLILHLTEWADYQAIDPAALGAVVAQRTVIDARCALDAGVASRRLVGTRPGTVLSTAGARTAAAVRRNWALGYISATPTQWITVITGYLPLNQHYRRIRP